jgi:hypothetical protein
VIGVRTDFAEDCFLPHRCGTEAPVTLSGVHRFEGNAGRSAGKLRLDDPDLSESSRSCKLARMADHRKARIAVSDDEEPARCGDLRRKLLGLGEVARHRLLADDVDPLRQERDRRILVDLGRCCNDDDIDAVIPLRLAPCHLAEIVIDAVLGNQQGSAGPPRHFRIDREGAGHKLVAAVGLEGDAVRLADDRIEAAAHHAETQAATEFCQ